MSKKLTHIPYTQFFTGDAERFISTPSPYPVPKGFERLLREVLNAGLKFGVKAYADGKATRIFTYRNHDHNDVAEVIDVFKGSSNDDIDYAHRRLVSKSHAHTLRYNHAGKSA